MFMTLRCTAVIGSGRHLLSCACASLYHLLDYALLTAFNITSFDNNAFYWYILYVYDILLYLYHCVLLCRLLSVVAVQGEARIVDVTGMAAALELHKQQQQQESLADEATAVAGVSSKGVKSTKAAAVGAVDAASVSMLTLPHRLTQLEIRSPSEDKDALTYLFLLKVCHCYY